MKTFLMAVSIALVAECALAGPVPPTLPGDSIYQADIMLLNDRGERFAWRDQRGQPQIVSMFYTSCTFTCPMLIEGAKAVQANLTPDERARLHVTFITLDPARDSTRTLAKLRVDRDLGRAQWTLARVDAADVPKAAALLGVRYRALADGNFNHTSVLVLLDADGSVVARTERIGGVPDPAFLAAVRGALRPAHAH
jgi:protein SCO1/2